jgi:phospholipid-translocating ATPase
MFSKGGDSRMVPLTLATDKHKTLEKVDDFALKGYRTLIFGMKEITGLDDRSKNYMNMEFVEEDLTLLGVTAVEDLLAENVQECITDFHDAGINVWMLTGDKGETAL